MVVNGITIDEASPTSAAAQYIAGRDKPRTSNATHTVSVLAEDQPHAITDTPVVNDDAVIDEPEAPAAAPKKLWTNPETGETKERPTRGDKRHAKVWQEREAERQMRVAAEKRVTDLEAQLATRDAAPAGAAAAATTEDADALTMAAQGRIRPKPDRTAIGSTYTTYEDYVEDCAIWGGELAAEKRELLRESRHADLAAQQAGTVFQQERTAAKAVYPDFEQVTTQDLPITAEIAQAVIHAPAGLKGHVQYWLGKHPDETARIASLPPAAALVAMGEVIATVRAARQSNTDDVDRPKSKPKPQSDAPDPPDRSTARSASSTPISHVADPGAAGINPVDFMKARNAEEHARRRL